MNRINPGKDPLFDVQKHQCLSKHDKSIRGHIDVQIRPLVSLINSLPDFYTTSSCAGRIVLLIKNEHAKKFDSKWLFVSHDKVTLQMIKKPTKALPKDLIWLRQESFILHICARTIEAANSMLNLAKAAGFKHSGIMSVNKRIMLEIGGTENMDVPIADKGRLLVDYKYIGFLVKAANSKMQANRQKLKRFQALVRQQIK
jgi:tRNA wybutosine-synthesizing protein 3